MKKIPRVLHLGNLLPIVLFILGVFVMDGWMLTRDSDLKRNCFILCLRGGRGALEVK